MKERPIIFSAPMVRAILAGKKMQTRRAVKPFGKDGGFVILETDRRVWPYRSDDGESTSHTVKRGGKLYLDESPHSCPYGQPGDRLWVRETFSGPHCMDASNGCKAVPPSEWGRSSRIWYWADGVPTNGDWTRPRPSIHMPRWASRILVEITAVRVEQLQDISDADIEAEGAAQWVKDGGSVRSPHPGFDGQWPDAAGTVRVKPNRVVFCSLWESINGPQSWDANPWVWVIEFKKV